MASTVLASLRLAGRIFIRAFRSSFGYPVHSVKKSATVADRRYMMEKIGKKSLAHP
jgi:hypothetical protein